MSSRTSCTHGAEKAPLQAMIPSVCSPSRICSTASRASSGSSVAMSLPMVGGSSEAGEVALQLEPGDLSAVVVPLGPLVAQEEVEDVLPQRLGDQVAALHDADRLVQRRR